MDQKQLERVLNSVGKACFIKYFEYFKNQNYTHLELVEMLHQKEGYAISACRTRVSKSRKIINEGMVEDALNIILSSKRVDGETLMKAKKLMRDC